MSGYPGSGFNGSQDYHETSDTLSQQMQNVALSDTAQVIPTGRKKKARHVLDASLTSEQQNGFTHSQFASQGIRVPDQEPVQAQGVHAHTSNQFYQQDQFDAGTFQHQNIHRQVLSGTAAGPQTVYTMTDGQFPSIVDDIIQSSRHYQNHPHDTARMDALAPPAYVDFTAIDNGVSNPRFARLSMGSVPATEEVLSASCLPLSIVLQPLADLKPAEGVVPVVDFTNGAVPRCHRCRAYINPSTQFINGGAKFQCNICGFASETPQDYYSPSDYSGRRQDWSLRPELQFGTCDFLVGKDYWVKDLEPKPLHILFAIDVSEQALLRGIPKATTAAIREALYGHDHGELPPGVKIGLVSFDRACHFYNLSTNVTQSTQMLCVTDVENMFVPMSDGLFADPQESRQAIEMALETISTVFERESVPEPALGALCAAAFLALHDHGGKLCLFLGALPSWGPGKLKMRENTSVYNTSEERTLYDAASIHWKNVSEEFVGIGVGVDCFLFPNSYIDVATVGTMSQVTGGDMFYYQNFIAERDALKFSNELSRCLFRSQGVAVQMKIRCSNGLKVVQMVGNFLRKGPADLEMGSIDADKTIACVFRHDGKLDPKVLVHFQSAILFTSPDGKRILRTHNIKCSVSPQIGTVMRHCDVGAAIATIAKLAVIELYSHDLKVVKERITDQCVRILAGYRKNCGGQAPAVELLLPESLKLFPLMSLAIQKQFSFRTDSINSDVRVNNQRLIRSCSVYGLLSLIYPRLIPIHSLSPHEGFANEAGVFIMPPAVPNSFSQLAPGGAYILDNGHSMLLWFRSDVNPALIQDLYGPEFTSLESLQPRISELPILDTLLNVQVRNIIAYLNTFSTSRHLVPQIARQSLDGSEMIFAQGLIDDRNCDNMSYSDFMSHVHKRVQHLLLEGHNSKGSFGNWISGTEQVY